MSVSSPSTARRLSTFQISSALPSGFVYDADAETYLAAVEAADGSALEAAVRLAVTKFVAGCKTDGNWTAIKAACILCGARTLSGALTPLAGTAPTNNNFVSGDYSRTTGLIGNGTTKWLNSNRNNATDGQNDFHMVCFVNTQATSTNTAYMGAGAATNETGASNFGLGSASPSHFIRARSSSNSSVNAGAAPFVLGVSRSASASYTARVSGSSTTVSVASQAPTSAVIAVYAATGGAYASNPRLLYYSIGAALSLSSLETRLLTLRADIAAALA